MSIISTHHGRTRIMANLIEDCIDILAGVFYVTETSGTIIALEFYVRTCKEPEYDLDGASEARTKRQNDLNEQYIDVAYRLLLQYQERVHYVRAMPDPFF